MVSQPLKRRVVGTEVDGHWHIAIFDAERPVEAVKRLCRLAADKQVSWYTAAVLRGEILQPPKAQASRSA